MKTNWKVEKIFSSFMENTDIELFFFLSFSFPSLFIYTNKCTYTILWSLRNVEHLKLKLLGSSERVEKSRFLLRKAPTKLWPSKLFYAESSANVFVLNNKQSRDMLIEMFVRLSDSSAFTFFFFLRIDFFIYFFVYVLSFTFLWHSTRKSVARGKI